MKQFKTLFGTIAGTALTLACVESFAGNTNTFSEQLDSQAAAFIVLADNSSAMRDSSSMNDDDVDMNDDDMDMHDDDAAPAMGGEGDDVPGGNAPNPDPDRSVSTVIDDATITASVKASLLADTTVSGLKIDVDTRSGVVYLTGDNIDSQAAIDRAVELARETDGVTKVVSKLAVRDVQN